tara:strand:+ start:1230 stop:1433 length:204 start_codon:yes stop_codon:yes gene_type:complete
MTFVEYAQRTLGAVGASVIVMVSLQMPNLRQAEDVNLGAFLIFQDSANDLLYGIACPFYFEISVKKD